MENQFVKQYPELMRGKKLMYVHGFGSSAQSGTSGDIIAEDLKMVLEELGEITGGQISSQETLNNIFKHFCIGK